jgi:hypothetical protein
MTEEVDEHDGKSIIEPMYWDDIRALDPGDVCQRGEAAFQDGAYRVRMLGAEYLVKPGSETIVGPEPADGVDEDTQRVLIAYLLGAKDLPLCGRAVTGAELPSGGFFFRGLHSLPTAPLEKAFGRSPEEFRAAAVALGGAETESGADQGFAFALLPRMPLTCLMWFADDEFPARTTFLFDATAAEHLTLDMLLLAAMVLVSRLIGSADAI